MCTTQSGRARNCPIPESIGNCIRIHTPEEERRHIRQSFNEMINEKINQMIIQIIIQIII